MCFVGKILLPSIMNRTYLLLSLVLLFHCRLFLSGFLMLIIFHCDEKKPELKEVQSGHPVDLIG